jgi:hypothetical protein
VMGLSSPLEGSIIRCAYGVLPCKATSTSIRDTQVQ